MDSLTLEGPGLGAGLWTGSLAQFPLTLWPPQARSTRASSGKTRGFHTQLDQGPENP